MLSNLFRRGELIPMISQVPQKDIWKGFPSLAQREASVTESFSWLEKWSRDFPLQRFESCVWRSCQPGSRVGSTARGRWGTGTFSQQCHVEAHPCAWVWRKAVAGNTCSPLWAVLHAKPHGAVRGFATHLLDAAYSTNIAAVWAGFNFGGDWKKVPWEGLYEEKTHKPFFLTQLCYFHKCGTHLVWHPIDLFTAFVSHICWGFPNIDISLIWPGSDYCTENPA